MSNRLFPEENKLRICNDQFSSRLLPEVSFSSTCKQKCDIIRLNMLKSLSENDTVLVGTWSETERQKKFYVEGN